MADLGSRGRCWLRMTMARMWTSALVGGCANWLGVAGRERPRADGRSQVHYAAECLVSRTDRGSLPGDMPRRWIAAGMAEAQRSFRRVKGCRDLPKFLAAIRREPNPTPTAEEAAALIAAREDHSPGPLPKQQPGLPPQQSAQASSPSGRGKRIF